MNVRPIDRNFLPGVDCRVADDRRGRSEVVDNAHIRGKGTRRATGSAS